MSVTFYPGQYVEYPEWGTILGPVEGRGDRDVDMHGGSAARVLPALGLPVDSCDGVCGAEDFLGRVLTALALAPHDDGMPSHQLPPGQDTPLGPVPDGVVWVECARSEGALQRHLEKLRILAEFCKANDYWVLWA